MNQVLLPSSVIICVIRSCSSQLRLQILLLPLLLGRSVYHSWTMNLAYNTFYSLIISNFQDIFQLDTVLVTSNRIVLMQDKDEVQHQISILLFIGLACGVTMMVLTRLFGSWALTGNK